jgi:hypothetical protein
LQYLLKGNIVVDRVDETEIELSIHSFGIDKSKIVISYENSKPLFILIESVNNDLCKKIESINYSLCQH